MNRHFLDDQGGSEAGECFWERVQYEKISIGTGEGKYIRRIRKCKKLKVRKETVTLSRELHRYLMDSIPIVWMGS